MDLEKLIDLKNDDFYSELMGEQKLLLGLFEVVKNDMDRGRESWLRYNKGDGEVWKIGTRGEDNYIEGLRSFNWITGARAARCIRVEVAFQGLGVEAIYPMIRRKVINEYGRYYDLNRSMSLEAIEDRLGYSYPKAENDADTGQIQPFNDVFKIA
jgi:hypothetical protein